VGYSQPVPSGLNWEEVVLTQITKTPAPPHLSFVTASITLMLSLPLASLESMSLKKELDNIGMHKDREGTHYYRRRQGLLSDGTGTLSETPLKLLPRQTNLDVFYRHFRESSNPV
jgi:hypothetical protein